jgi:hypothetical protein
VINCQRVGSGSLTAASAIGAEVDDAVLPDDLDIAAGETIIAAETFYAFEPLFSIGLTPLP